MKLEEITIMKVTPPNKKKRASNDFWNLEKMPELREAIEFAEVSGKESYVMDWKHMSLFHVKPEFPLIPEAMQRTENSTLLKVSITAFHPAFHLGVRLAADKTERDASPDAAANSGRNPAHREPRNESAE